VPESPNQYMQRSYINVPSFLDIPVHVIVSPQRYLDIVAVFLSVEKQRLCRISGLNVND